MRTCGSGRRARHRGAELDCDRGVTLTVLSAALIAALLNSLPAHASDKCDEVGKERAVSCIKASVKEGDTEAAIKAAQDMCIAAGNKAKNDCERSAKLRHISSVRGHCDRSKSAGPCYAVVMDLAYCEIWTRDGPRGDGRYPGAAGVPAYGHTEHASIDKCPPYLICDYYRMNKIALPAAPHPHARVCDPPKEPDDKKAESAAAAPKPASVAAPAPAPTYTPSYGPATRTLENLFDIAPGGGLRERPAPPPSPPPAPAPGAGRSPAPMPHGVGRDRPESSISGIEEDRRRRAGLPLTGTTPPPPDTVPRTPPLAAKPPAASPAPMPGESPRRTAPGSGVGAGPAPGGIRIDPVPERTETADDLAGIRRNILRGRDANY